MIKIADQAYMLQQLKSGEMGVIESEIPVIILKQLNPS